MKIIPVIDIKNGQAVKAVKGERSTYKPVKSSLCPSSNPIHVLAAFIEATKAETIYIADLDAIENNGDNYSIICNLAKKFPLLTFWVDAGFRSQKQITFWKKIPQLIPVIGTESHTDLASIIPLLKEEAILSLDFKKGQLLGPTKILESSTLWPLNVIVMMLDAVGGSNGPNFPLIDQITNTKPQAHFFAAGGVSQDIDLEQLSNRNIKGVLVASALHDQRLSLMKVALNCSETTMLTE